MFGLKKILAFGASSLMAFGGVSLANEVEVKVNSDAAQVKGVVRGTVEFVVPFDSKETKADEIADVASEAVAVKADEVADVASEAPVVKAE